MGHILPNESKNRHSFSFKGQDIYYFMSSYKKRYGLFLWMGFNCLKATELLRVRSLKIIWILFLGHRQEDESGLPQFKQVFQKTTGWHECSISNL